MTEWYRLDGQALTYAEYWRMSSRVPPFLIAAVRKALHVPVRFSFSIPRPSALHILQPGDIPGWVRRKWQAAVEACQDRGLALRFCHTVPLLETNREGYGAWFLSVDGLTAAALASARTHGRDGTSFACCSRLPEGGCFVTSDQRRKLEPHPDDEIVRFPGADPSEIVDRHLQAMREPGRRFVRMEELDFPRLVLEREQRHVDFHIVRGVYVRMTEEEIDRIVCAQDRLSLRQPS
jgi:hypothetical protein